MTAAFKLETKSEAEDTTVDEVKAALEALTGEVQTKAASFEDLTARLAKLEAKAQRPANDNRQAPANDNDVEKKALNSFFRSGASGLDAEERKTLNLGTPSAGGYVTAPDYSTRIIERLTEFSPMRQVASVMSIGTTEVYIPTLEANAAGGWVTETGPRPSSEPEFDQVNIKVFEHAVIVPVSQQLLEDSFIDLQSYLAGHIATQFGKAEASAFVVGDGNGKPTGLLDDVELFDAVTAAANGSDIIEKVIEAFYRLPSAYAARANWLMNRRTMGIIRAAADTTTKGTLWSDSLANGTPPTLLGRPVREAPDMADLGEDATPIAFGDYAAAYQIIDRVGVQIMRDDYTGADNGIVKFRARRRVGGKTVLPEAVVVVNGPES